MVGWAEDGIAVPPHVDLMGLGAGSTYVIAGVHWAKRSTFALQDSNLVQGITFKVLSTYAAASDEHPTDMFMLGVRWPNAAGGLNSVSNVIITNKVCARTRCRHAVHDRQPAC